ncbi:MAG: VCBS repeat-containing protein [Nitrospirae bacterium]|nr:VCBS repeat-containing protein [Nitrospirota bacterium]
MDEVYNAIQQGPLLGHVYAHGNTDWGHYVVMRGIDQKGTPNDRSDDIIYINDPYDVWNSTWDTSGNNKAVKYKELFDRGARYGGKWFRDAVALSPNRSYTGRLNTVVVDTGNNDFGGNTTKSNVFQIDTPNATLADGSYVWRFYYGPQGDWYYPKEVGHSVRWTPNLLVDGNYELLVRYYGDHTQNNVQYDIYGDTSGTLLSSRTIDQRVQGRHTESIGTYNLKKGAYVRVDNVPVDCNIDAIMFSPPTFVPSTDYDFNGDGKSDILWRSTRTGQLVTWVIGGSSVTSDIGSPDTIGPNLWQIKGMGDFNGDSKSDILWRNSSTGDLTIWIMKGTKRESYGSPDKIGSEWQFVGIGDFDGDGKSDILWRNSSTGDLTIWIMKGTDRDSYGSPGKIASEWQFVGIGDFNGDSKSDILWRNSTTGDVTIWIMKGTDRDSHGSPDKIGSEWQFVGIGDFDGDGKSNILWRNSSTGDLTVWFMNGTKRESYNSSPGTIGSEWQFVGTGDYNGDDKSDFLLRNTTDGRVRIILNEMSGSGSRVETGPIDLDWQIK